MKIGPYTVSRGAILPLTETTESEQTQTVMLDGSVAIFDDWDCELKKVRIRVPRAEALNIRGFLRYGVRYAALPFEIQDDYGNTWWVRYWGGSKIDMETIVSNLVEMNLVFRVEVS